jgi:hypothetical protein
MNNYLSNYLSTPAKELAGKLVKAWGDQTLDQVFRVRFDFQDRGTATAYGYGLEIEAADSLGLRLGALRELQNQKLILMNESEYNDRSELNRGTLEVQVTLLQTLSYAVEMDFQIQI